MSIKTNKPKYLASAIWATSVAVKLLVPPAGAAATHSIIGIATLSLALLLATSSASRDFAILGLAHCIAVAATPGSLGVVGMPRTLIFITMLQLGATTQATPAAQVKSTTLTAVMAIGLIEAAWLFELSGWRRWVALWAPPLAVAVTAIALLLLHARTNTSQSAKE
jgi:hypothetical protein